MTAYSYTAKSTYGSIIKIDERKHYPVLLVGTTKERTDVTLFADFFERANYRPRSIYFWGVRVYRRSYPLESPATRTCFHYAQPHSIPLIPGSDVQHIMQTPISHQSRAEPQPLCPGLQPARRTIREVLLMLDTCWVDAIEPVKPYGESRKGRL